MTRNFEIRNRRLEEMRRPEDEDHERAEGGAFAELMDDLYQPCPLRPCPEHHQPHPCIDYVPIMFSLYSRVKLPPAAWPESSDQCPFCRRRVDGHCRHGKETPRTVSRRTRRGASPLRRHD